MSLVEEVRIVGEDLVKEVGTKMQTTEVTPSYSRIAGSDIAGDPKEAIQELVEQFRKFDITPFMLKEFDTFEQTFIAVMILKFHMMLGKQKDYGPGNISKAGLRGLITRTQDKLERVKTLVGDPDAQVAQAKQIVEAVPEDASAAELDMALAQVYRILNPSNAVGDERIDDTLMDLGNYGDIGYVLHHQAWGKPLEENL